MQKHELATVFRRTRYRNVLLQEEAVGVLAALGTGAAAGLFNGLVVTMVGLPSLVVTIGTQFLLWEYFDGEEIRSENYTASVVPVPVPGAAILGFIGMATSSLALRGKRKKKVAA